MTRYLSDRGIESRFVDGLRVTTPETVDAVLKVLAGSVNHELVASLKRHRKPGVGMLIEIEEPGLGVVAGRQHLLRYPRHHGRFAAYHQRRDRADA